MEETDVTEQSSNTFFLSTLAPPFFNQVYANILGGYTSAEDYMMNKCR